MFLCNILGKPSILVTYYTCNFLPGSSIASFGQKILQHLKSLFHVDAS